MHVKKYGLVSVKPMGLLILHDRECTQSRWVMAQMNEWWKGKNVTMNESNNTWICISSWKRVRFGRNIKDDRPKLPLMDRRVGQVTLSLQFQSKNMGTQSKEDLLSQKKKSLKVHFLWLSDVTILYLRGNLVGWGFHLKKKKRDRCGRALWGSLELTFHR